MFLVVGQVTGSIKLSTLHDVSYPALNLRARGERKGRVRRHNDGIERLGIADGVVETAMGATAILCTGLALSAYSEAIASFFSGKQVSTAFEPMTGLCGTGGSTCLCGPSCHGLNWPLTLTYASHCLVVS